MDDERQKDDGVEVVVAAERSALRLPWESRQVCVQDGVDAEDAGVDVGGEDDDEDVVDSVCEGLPCRK